MREGVLGMTQPGGDLHRKGVVELVLLGLGLGLGSGLGLGLGLGLSMNLCS